MKRIFLSLILSALATFGLAQQQGSDLALSLVKANSEKLGMSQDEIANSIVSDSYFNQFAGTQMVYLQQSYLGLPVVRQIQVLAFKDGKLVSAAGERIAGMPTRAGLNAIPAVSAEKAVTIAMNTKNVTSTAAFKPTAVSPTHLNFGKMGVSREDITARLMWAKEKNSNDVTLVWEVYLVPVTTSDYFLIRVDAVSGRIQDEDNLTVYCNLPHPNGESKNHHRAQHGETINEPVEKIADENISSLTSPTSSTIVGTANYRVIPFPAESILHPGGTPAVVTNPWLLTPGNATSLGWHNDGGFDYSFTRGNNVFAQEDRDKNDNTFGNPAVSTTTPDPLNFNFTPDFSVAPIQTAPIQNQQFNITNLFYWNNIIHDLSYIYGFDEVSGNFQNNNQGRGGAGGDYVIADAQDSEQTNNANFATPADGQRPRMQMFLWGSAAGIQRDASADNSIIVHEYGHGISNRLTGGPSQSGCLNNDEQMGEGWSDYLSLMYTQDWASANLNTGFSNPRGIGTYAEGQTPSGSGMRSRKYTTNMAVNNLVFTNNLPGPVHDRGEIWAATLWDMTWNIINQTGVINPSLFNPTADGGNAIALKLVMEGMRLQPCDPGFIDARNAILQADQILYGGVYSCAIKEAFRRRGMGANATQGSSDNLTDQRADFTGSASVQLSQGGVTSVGEGQNIVYTNTVTTCEVLSNYVLRDTLPANVTWVSGGTYDNTTRVVSWAVNVPAGGSQTYTFTVKVNDDAYFPSANLFEETVDGATFPTSMTSTSSVPAGQWVTSTVASHSAPKSFFTPNLGQFGDQQLITVNPISIPANSSPRLNFWHRFSTESGWDGGVVEISTNNGTTWSDLGSTFIANGYNANLGTVLGYVLSGRAAFSGSTSNTFINSVAKLSNYAGQNVKLRFRFGSNNNGVVGTGSNPGWFVDDIRIINQAVVDMRSALHNPVNQLVSYSDTTTLITEQATCTNVAIGTQPLSAIVCAGSNATFTVVATGSSPSYQWQVSTNGGTTWTNITGANSSTLTLTGTSGTLNNNQYRVLVNNTCPSSVTSAAATLTVSTPATITAQPSAVTTCTGGSASFSVTATGSGITYQWQVSTDGGTNYTNVPAGTSSSLNITPVTASMNGNRYRVVIASCDGPLNSNAAILTVNEGVSITTQPSNQNVCSGSNAVFTVTAAGASPAYQWQVSTNGGGSWTNISGATSATLTIPSAAGTLDGNQYRVLVSNACPSNVTSASATLFVSTAGSIITQPVNQTVCAGENASFSVTATGTNLSYQWQVSTDGGTNFTNITSATSPGLTLPAVNASLNGNRYRVVVTGCSGPANSNAASLAVNGLASITIQPANVTACSGENAVFTVTATGPGLTYQWQVSTNGGTSFSNITGETTSTLTVAAVTGAMNNNQYRVVVGNSCTTGLNSGAATLSVSANASITTQPQPVIGCAGSNATFTIAATGAIGYQWRVSTNGGTSFTNIAGATSSSLTLNAITAGMNNNQYQVLIDGCGAAGLTSAPASLTVNAAASISAQPASVDMVCAGSPVSFNITATGNLLTYQWQVSTDNGGSWSNINGETSTSLDIIAAAGMNGNQYRVLVNGTCAVNLASAAATLTLAPAPAITAQPQDQAVCETGNALFTVTAANGTIQWEVSTDGGITFAPIAGATSATLTISTVTPSMHGNEYRAVITGVCSGITSNSAELTVTTTPNIGIDGPAGAVCAGETITLSGSGASTYAWDNGVSNNVPFIIQQTTTYTVTGTASGNCSGTATITVTVNQPPVVTLSADPTELEPGESSTITATANPAASVFTWFRNGQVVAGQTGSTLVVSDLETGAYTASSEGSNGCTGLSAPINITLADPNQTFITPNPNFGVFTVRYLNANTSATSRALAIYDSKGSRIFYKVYPVTAGTLVETMNVDIRNAPSGVYIVALFEKGKRVRSEKVIVQ